MKLSIKTLNGEVFSIEVEPNYTVLQIKESIHRSRGDSPVERQKLIHSGKVLKDDQTITELGLSEADFLVVMLSKEVAKKTVASSSAPVNSWTTTQLPSTQSALSAGQPASAPPIVASSLPTASLQVPTVQPRSAAPAPLATINPAVAQQAVVNPEALEALVGMGFPESESRAALTAAMGNPDLAYEFLLNGIPDSVRSMQIPTSSSAMAPAMTTATSQSSSGTVSIELLRQHPQFNMLKRMVQQNPASLTQILNLIGQQNPQLLEAIHANNDAFIAMMNEPIVESSTAAPMPAIPQASTAANPLVGGMLPNANTVGGLASTMQLLQAMPPAQRAQFAQSIGLSPDQLEQFVSMMNSMPPGEMQHMMSNPPNVVRLTEEEVAAVNRLTALGFTQQQAAQAYLACDKNEALAANLLLEGGWGDDDGDVGGGFGDGGHDDDMYS